ncbi:MAG: hypothetical protein CSA42_07465, partial [Gammaproteobacteria bacterium]
MQLNKSNINAGKDLIIDSNHQLITNGQRKPGTNAKLEHPDFKRRTTLEADKVVSIKSRYAQRYKETDIAGGAVIINSGSSIGFSENSNSKEKFFLSLRPMALRSVTVYAQGHNKLANDSKKIYFSGKQVPTSSLNGDLLIQSKNNLTIDQQDVDLHSTGDITLSSTNGRLYVQGHATTKGWLNKSADVMTLQAPEDINLIGKSVKIEGANLKTENRFVWDLTDFSKIDVSKNLDTDALIKKYGYQYYVDSAEYQAERNKQIKANTRKVKKDFSAGINTFKPLTGNINIIATDGSVELKGIKNKIDDSEICLIGSGCSGGYLSTHRIKVVQEQIKLTNEAMKSVQNNKSLSQKDKNEEIHNLKKVLSDLNQILEMSKKPSKGYEHKVVNIKAIKDSNITAKKGGILMEGTDINAANINIKADGNLTTGDSIRITGLADVYTKGNVKKGKITGPNYSYHQLINQAKLDAKKDINIAGKGNLAKKGINNAVIVNSANINAKGNVNIDAITGDLLLEASQVAFMDGSQHTSTSRTWYGKKKVKTTTKVTENSNAITTDITANNIKLKSDGHIKIYGSELSAGRRGDVDIEAGKGLYLYSIEDRKYSNTDIKKRSSWLGIRYNKDHTNDTHQEISQLPTKLIGGKAYTKSGHNTLLEGTVFDTLKPADIQVGVGKYASKDAKLILAPIAKQIQNTHSQQKESTVWQKQVSS